MTALDGDTPDSCQRRERRAELRNVIAMSIPVVVTTSSRAVMDIADYIMITGLHRPEAQAAILPAQIIMWTYIILGLGVASMVNTFASQALGRKSYAECSAYAWQGLYIAAAFGLIGLALRPLLPRLIAAIGHEPAVQVDEIAYGRVALLTVAPTIAANALGWFFIGVHRPWTTMWSAIEANVVNIALSVVLVFGYFGFEPMGIAGAAWGTFAAVCYRTVRLLIALMGPSMATRFASRRMWRPSAARLWNITRVGMPCGLQWLCDVVVWAIFVNVLIGARFGTAHLIATNIAWQFMRLAFFPVIGVGQALTALVGKSIGGGNPQRAMRETRIAVWITLAYMGSLSLVYWFRGAALIRLFSDDATVIQVGTTIMACAAVFQLFDALAITYQSALRGAGDTLVPSVFFLICNWLIIVGGGWWMTTRFPQLESFGAWLAASGLIVIAGMFLWWRWRSGAWIRIALMDDRNADSSAVECAAGFAAID